MSDVKLALEELRDESESGKLMRPVSRIVPSRFSKLGWVWPAAALGVRLGGTLAWTYRNHAAGKFRAPELTRLSPDDAYPTRRLPSRRMASSSPTDRSGNPELWLQQVGGTVPIQLTHSQNGVVSAAFFPDGRFVYN
jgi:eukaryotic-like serine/threonine-protein kinase